MNYTRLQELAAAYAIGALEAPEATKVEALAASDPDFRAELDAFREVASGLLGEVPPVAPPAEVRERVLARIRQTPQRQQPPFEPQSIKTPVGADGTSHVGFRFLRPGDGGWTEGWHPGSRFQVLASNLRQNYLMLYFELDPGAKFPAHTHIGAEELYLVRGDLLTEGRLMKTGDFVHAEPGSHHNELISPSGCHAILIAPLASAIGDAAKLGQQRAKDTLLANQEAVCK